MSARLAELGEAVPAAKQRERECQAAHRRVVNEIARFGDVIADAYAIDDETRAAKASKERASLERVALREAEERLEGARRAVQRAEAERGVFAAENVKGLVAERRPDAHAVARAAEEAVKQLGRAHAEWNRVYSEVGALLRLAGADTATMPSFPQRLEQLARDARRADGIHVPPPIPGGQSMVPATPPPVIPASLPPLDPDQKPPTTREAA